MIKIKECMNLEKDNSQDVKVFHRCDQNWAFHSLAALNLAAIIELRLIWAGLNSAYHNSALA